MSLHFDHETGLTRESNGLPEQTYGHQFSRRELEDQGLVHCVNMMLDRIGGIQGRLSSLDDVGPSMFVVMFEKMFGVYLQSIIRKPMDEIEHAHNAQVIIDLISSVVLKVPLPQISGIAICHRERPAVLSLLGVFLELDRIITDQADGVTSLANAIMTDEQRLMDEIKVFGVEKKSGGGGGGGGCGDDEAADQAHSNSVAQLAHETIEDRLKNPALRSARDFLESLATKTGRGPNRDTCTYKSAYAQQRDEEVREAASTQRDEQLNQFLRGGGRPPGNDLWYFEKGTKKQSSGEVAKLEDEFVKHCTAKDPLSGSLETELPPEARNILASRKPALDSSLKQALKPAINNHPSMWKRRPNNPAANQLSAALGDVLEYHEQCIHDERAREVASVNRLNLEYSQRLLSLYQHFRQEVNGLSRNFQQNEEERKRSEEEFQKKLQQSNRELKIKPFDPLYKPTKHKPSNRVHFIPSPKVVRQLKHRVVKKAWRPEGTASEIQTTSQALGLDAHFAQYSEMRRARDEARRQKLR